MSRHIIAIRSSAERARAAQDVARAPIGTRVTFTGAKRSLEQNSIMWSYLGDIAKALPWHGQMLEPSDWKLLFLDALARESRTVPSLDGTGFVDLGRSSSDLSKTEMSDLIELIRAFGSNHGISFIDDPAAPPLAPGPGTRIRERVPT